MKWLKKLLILLLASLLIFFILNFLYPLNIHRLSKPQSTLIYDKNHQLLSVKLSSDGFLRIPIKKITNDIEKIVLGYEDQYFYQHMGINPLAILRAVWFNLNNRRQIGASTITMQVARMMHQEKRTLSQKFIELFNALQLEFYYSKEEILAFYLNNAPYGGNVEGFASASFRYFNVDPSSLSWSQIAYLSSIPKNPNANRPKAKRDLNKIKNRLLQRLYALHLLDKQLFQELKKENIVVKVKNLPHKIPHLSAKITKEGEIYTSINQVFQEKIEQLLYSRVKELKNFGIYNASALLIENKTMEILAYVGSNDFKDKLHGGENDGIQALFSPGSTLKPLVYAKALEEGLITPLKKLFDIPLFINGYQPTNYSKTYMGEVTATEALQFSLNISAVELDQLLGENSLYSLLQKANIRAITHPKSFYGSALTLGGLGLSLQENAELFALFANKGIYTKAHFIKEKKSKKIRILSEESSYLISNILANSPRLEFSSSWEYLEEMPKIAFKTGTSAYAKDMLTLGYTPQYTVAVWFGNFSGKASKRYKNEKASGLKIASPTLFKIFKILGHQSWFERPKNIEIKTICQDAIQLKQCQEKREDYIIKGVQSKNECRVMRAEVLSYLLEQHKIESITQLTQHPCYEEWKSYQPLITSPIHTQHYAQNKALPQELKKSKLQCYSFEKNSTIYWLIDKEEPLVGESGIPLYHYFSPRKHQITCLDEGAKKQTIEVFFEEI